MSDAMLMFHVGLGKAEDLDTPTPSLDGQIENQNV